jgi:hypothetical protein
LSNCFLWFARDRDMRSEIETVTRCSTESRPLTSAATARHRWSRSRRGGTGNVPVRLHGKGNVGAKPKGEVMADILAAIKERRA